MLCLDGEIPPGGSCALQSMKILTRISCSAESFFRAESDASGQRLCAQLYT